MDPPVTAPVANSDVYGTKCAMSGITLDQLNSIVLSNYRLVHAALLEDWTMEYGSSWAPDGTKGLTEQNSMTRPLVSANIDVLEDPVKRKEAQCAFFIKQIHSVIATVIGQTNGSANLETCPYLYIKVLLAMLVKTDASAALQESVRIYNSLNHVISVNTLADAIISLVLRFIESLIDSPIVDDVIVRLDMHSANDVVLSILQTLIEFQTYR
jgi:hypothetical protein